MYPVSDRFHELAKSGAPTRCRIYFITDSVDCTDDADVVANGTLLVRDVGDTDSGRRISGNGGIAFSDLFNTDSNVQIGCTVSKPITMNLLNNDGGLSGFAFGRCKVYIDVLDETNETWIQCPMGVYIIDAPASLNATVVTANGYDQMQKLDQVVDSWWTELDFSGGLTVYDLIQSIATACGVTLSTDLQNHILNGSNTYYESPFTPTGKTFRDALAYLAGVTGTIAYFDRDGALDMRWFDKAIESVDTDTYTGVVATFTGAGDQEITAVTTTLTPQQDLHGYSSPWPAGGGKNKFYYPTSFNTTGSYGLVFKYDKDTETFSITGTNTHTSAYIALFLKASDGISTPSLTAGQTCYIYHNLPIGTYLNLTYFDGNGVNKGFSIIGGAAGTGDYVQRSFIVPNDYASYSQVQIGVYGSATQINKTDIHIALGTDSAFTEWTPYSNICPISGRTGCEVYRTGINVWDEEWENGRFNTTTGENVNNVSANLQIRTKNLIPIVGGKSYYFYYPNTGAGKGLWTMFYDSGKNIITGFVPSGSYVDKSGNCCLFNKRVVEVPQNAAYCKFYCTGDYGDTYNNDISINYPSTDTGYHAYNGSTYAFDWSSPAGTVYGCTVDLVTGVLTVDRASVLFDGSQSVGLSNWMANASSVGWLYTPSATPGIDNVEIKSANIQTCGFISDTLETVVYGGSSGIYGATKPCISLVGQPAWGVAMRVNDTSLTTNTAINNWLSAHPVRVVYYLATPLTYQLTPQIISILQGPNNFWASTGTDVSVTVNTYNQVTIDTDVPGSGCFGASIADYTVTPIGSLQIFANDPELNASSGYGSNAYSIYNNPFYIGADAAVVEALADPVFARLSALSPYRPVSTKLVWDWSIEAGDIVTFIVNEESTALPIMQQKMTWRGGFVFSEIGSSGDAARPAPSETQRTNYQTQQALSNLEATTALLRSLIQDMSGNYTLIEQTVSNIAQTVSGQGSTIQSILDPTGQIWTAITNNSTNLSSLEAAVNGEISERKSYIRFIPSEPAVVLGVATGNEIKLKLVNNVIYFFNGDDDSTDLSLAYAYFNSEESGADRFIAKESIQIGNDDTVARWQLKQLSNGDLVLDLI